MTDTKDLARRMAEECPAQVVEPKDPAGHCTHPADKRRVSLEPGYGFFEWCQLCHRILGRWEVAHG